MVARRWGKAEATAEQTRQKKETKANWTMVRVAGLSRVMRMDLEEVLVRTDEVYQSIHRTLRDGSMLAITPRPKRRRKKKKKRERNLQRGQAILAP